MIWKRRHLWFLIPVGIINAALVLWQPIVALLLPFLGVAILSAAFPASGLARSSARWVPSFLMVIAIPVFLYLAWDVQGVGLATLQEMRQFERVPEGRIAAVVKGEVHLKGQVYALDDERVVAPHSNSPCLYFDYRLEKEETDSDGNTSWKTIKTEGGMVPRFRLTDATGDIAVRPHGARFNVEEYQWTVGELRHTEYRMGEGDNIFLFGFSAPNKETGALEVVFNQRGDYTPIISSFGEVETRVEMASEVSLYSFVGLFLVSFAALFLCWLFRIHPIMLFLAIVCFSCVGALAHQGLIMLENDVSRSEQRVVRQEARTKAAIQEIFSSYPTEWDGNLRDEALFRKLFSKPEAFGFSKGEMQRLEGLYGELALTISRHNQSVEEFPVNLLGESWGVHSHEEIALAPELFAWFDEEKEVKEASVIGWAFYLMLALGIVGFGFGIRKGFQRCKTKRYIENIPTSPAAGLAYGPGELIGVLKPVKGFLKGPVSDEQCAWYRYKVEELQGSGDDASWVTIRDECKQCELVSEDASGTFPLDLEDAEVITEHRSYRGDSRMRYHEWRLHPGEEAYLLGTAIIDEETGDRLKLAKGDFDFPLLATHLSEQKIMVKMAHKGMFWLTVGLNGLILLTLAVLGAMGAFSPTDYLMAAILPMVFFVFCYVVLLYNDLLFLRHRVRRAWANIDVSLKKRADLLPALENTVKGYFEYESSLQTEFAALRSAAGADTFSPDDAGKLVVNERAFMKSLDAVVERYPDLKGEEVISHFRQELIALENEISLMRQGYNDSVERHNTRIGQVPEVMLAKTFGFEDESFLPT
jgi:hypothetical protein